MRDARRAVAKLGEGRITAGTVWVTKTIRAPIFASASAATSPIPDVPPVITTVFPHMTFVSAQ